MFDWVGIKLCRHCELCIILSIVGCRFRPICVELYRKQATKDFEVTSHSYFFKHHYDAEVKSGTSGLKIWKYKWAYDVFYDATDYTTRRNSTNPTEEKGNPPPFTEHEKASHPCPESYESSSHTPFLWDAF